MVYKYKALLPESKSFVKEYEVKPDMSLFGFNKFILNDLGFAPDQMVVFRGCDKSGKICGEYGLFDFGDGSIDQITFRQLVSKGETELQYYFDLRGQRYIKLIFEGETDYSPRYSYPRTTFEKGRNPGQFSKNHEDMDDFEDFNGAIEETSEAQESEDII